MYSRLSDGRHLIYETFINNLLSLLTDPKNPTEDVLFEVKHPDSKRTKG